MAFWWKKGGGRGGGVKRACVGWACLGRLRGPWSFEVLFDLIRRGGGGRDVKMFRCVVGVLMVVYDY